jgi:hypothetical protein
MKLFFFVIHFEGKKNFTATSLAFTHSLSLQHNKVEGILEEYRDIFSSPTQVPTKCQVKDPIDLTPSAPLPNGLVYHPSLMENDKIKCHIQDILQKGHIKPKSSPCRSLILLLQNKDKTW